MEDSFIAGTNVNLYNNFGNKFGGFSENWEQLYQKNKKTKNKQKQNKTNKQTNKKQNKTKQNKTQKNKTKNSYNTPRYIPKGNSILPP